MDVLRQDLRVALRGLVARPIVSAVVVASVALGVGANAALFGLVDHVLLARLPVPAAEELVVLEWHAGPEFPADALSGSVSFDEAGRSSSTSLPHPLFRRLEREVPGLEDVVGFADLDLVNVAVGGRGILARGEAVSGAFHATLAQRPVAGRLLAPADDAPGAAPVAVVSHRFWQRELGGRASAVGATAVVNGLPLTVVGVTAPGFHGVGEVDQAPDLVVPLAQAPALLRTPELLTDPGNWWVRVLGRVAPAERAAVATAASGLLRGAVVGARPDYPQPELLEVALLDGAQGLAASRAAARDPLVLLAALFAVVLALACANVAGLLLAAALRRRHELTMRLALGAGRTRLVRQLVTESLVLAVCGGAAGLLVAAWLQNVLPAALPWVDWGSGPDLRLGGRALAFAAALSLVAGLGFGLLPALRATRLRVATALGGRGTVAGRSRLGAVLVVGQLALSVALVASALLFVRTVHALGEVDLGFRPAGLVVARVDAARVGLEGERRRALERELLATFEALPGVASAAMSSFALVGGGSALATVGAVDGEPVTGRTIVGVDLVDPGFLATAGVTVRRGRAFAEGDREGAPAVAVVDATAARRLFGDGDPIGRRIELFGSDVEVVGVTPPVVLARVRGEVEETVFLPIAQHRDRFTRATFTLRTDGDPRTLLPAVRAAVAAAAPGLAPSELETQEALVSRSIRQERSFAILAGGFAVVAALLAALGLYGLQAFLVAGRTRETGVRMALGATRAGVVYGVLRESLALTALGVALGLPLVLVTGRLAGEILYGVRPADPWAALGAAAVLGVVAALAAAGPARRAAAVDPAASLRAD